jgi:hypothetical protein
MLIRGKCGFAAGIDLPAKNLGRRKNFLANSPEDDRIHLLLTVDC